MHPMTKTRAEPRETIISAVRPLILHEVTNQVASNAAGSRRRIVATEAASGANHARHHVSRQAQS
jgi:hypothetical protein